MLRNTRDARRICRLYRENKVYSSYHSDNKKIAINYLKKSADAKRRRASQGLFRELRENFKRLPCDYLVITL